jgi:Met-10+ like-protein
MKALLKRMLRPFYRGTKKILRPVADRLRGPLSRLLYPPEFETVFRNLEQITNNLKGYVDQSDQMLLAMFRTLHLPATPDRATPFTPVNLRNGRILSKHPAAEFLFVDANDLHQTPRILLGDYRPHVTEALRRLVRLGDCCVDLGAGIGYHTLTMAVAAGPQGRSFAIELDERQASLLRDNVQANELLQICEPMTPAHGSSEAEALRWLMTRLTTLNRTPDLVRIAAGFDPGAFREILRAWAETGSTRLLLSSRGASIAGELKSLSLWRIADDGSQFRTTPGEIEELCQGQEIHFIAAKALQ